MEEQILKIINESSFGNLNVIAKQNVKERLVTALEKEVLTMKRAGEILGLSTAQVSFIKDPKLWNNLGASPWNLVLDWVNSGQTLVEWSEKHGKVLSAKKEAAPIKTTQEAVERRGSEMDKEIAKIESIPMPQVKVKPEALAKREIELAEKKPKLHIKWNNLHYLLREREKEIAEELKAIDILLRHYK